MKPVCTVLIAALLFQMAGGPAAAGPKLLVSGDWIRLSVPTMADHSFDGSFMNVADGDTLLVETQSGPLRIPLRAIASLEVSTGRRSRAAEGAVLGICIGGGAGALLGFTSGLPPEEQLALIGGLALGALFGVIGGSWGAGIQVEEWRQVPVQSIRMGLRLGPSGQTLLSVSYPL